MMENLFDFEPNVIGKTNKHSNPDSRTGFTLLDADFPRLLPMVSLRNTGRQSAEPIDLEAITLEALFELTENQVDLFSPEQVDSGCFEPTPIQLFHSPSGSLPSLQGNSLRRSALEAPPALIRPSLQGNPLKRTGLEPPPPLIQPPSKKIKRVVSETPPPCAVPDEEGRFRDYQSQQWTTMFEELCAFIKKNGHCQVPHSYAENESLARWTKRQRYQYKLRQEGKPSTMSDDRIEALNALGFVWDSHSAVWEERLEELREYCRKQGHCLVPSQYDANQKLATWVKCQRRQYKLFVAGQRSNMTIERVTKLDQMGFTWELRSHAK